MCNCIKAVEEEPLSCSHGPSETFTLSAFSGNYQSGQQVIAQLKAHLDGNFTVMKKVRMNCHWLQQMCVGVLEVRDPVQEREREQELLANFMYLLLLDESLNSLSFYYVRSIRYMLYLRHKEIQMHVTVDRRQV